VAPLEVDAYWSSSTSGWWLHWWEWQCSDRLDARRLRARGHRTRIWIRWWSWI